jgi:hypothetical protein
MGGSVIQTALPGAPVTYVHNNVHDNSVLYTVMNTRNVNPMKTHGARSGAVHRFPMKLARQEEIMCHVHFPLRVTDERGTMCKKTRSGPIR